VSGCSFLQQYGACWRTTSIQVAWSLDLLSSCSKAGCLWQLLIFIHGTSSSAVLQTDFDCICDACRQLADPGH